MSTVLRRIGYCFLSMLLLLSLIGCNRNQAGVSGQVSLDHQPVHEGTIAFIPTEGTQSSAATSPIAEGKYTIAANASLLPGKFKVQINAPKKTGGVSTIPEIPGMLKGGQVDVTVEALPERYNTKTTLVRELKAGTNELNFELSTKE